MQRQLFVMLFAESINIVSDDISIKCYPGLQFISSPDKLLFKYIYSKKLCFYSFLTFKHKKS